MSVVIIDMLHASKKAEITIDGVPQLGAIDLQLDQEVYANPYEYKEGRNGEQYPAYRAGVRIWTLTVDGEAVFVTNDAPAVTKMKDRVRYSWGD